MNNISLLNYGTIRVNENNQFSVFDTIEVIGGKKNPWDAWKRLCECFPEVLSACEDFRFSGQGQRNTPVANQSTVLHIIDLLPASEKVFKDKSIDKRDESFYCKKLKNKLGGLTEVATIAGKIDLLTKTELIEIKHVFSWKCAIGQVQVYGKYYPNHQKRIHLFGTCQPSLLDVIKEHCQDLCIKVSYEKGGLN